MPDFQDFQSLQMQPMQQQQQQTSAFSFAQKKPALPLQDVAELSEVVRDSSSRLRVIEERYASLRKILQVNEQNLIKLSKDIRAEVKTLSEEVSELKAQLAEVKDELKLVIAELKATAKKEDIEMLNKYINLWEPLNFVTQKDVELIIRRVLDQQKNQS